MWMKVIHWMMFGLLTIEMLAGDTGNLLYLIGIILLRISYELREICQ